MHGPVIRKMKSFAFITQTDKTCLYLFRHVQRLERALQRRAKKKKDAGSPGGESPVGVAPT